METISDGVIKPNLLESIHCLFKKKTPTSETAITYKDVVEKENPFKKIKLGCTKNIQPENIVPVDTTANTQPGKYLPNIKNSEGVVIFL